MTIAPARRAAYEVIRRVFEQEAYADRALTAAVEGLDQRDRALAQRLAYGTVQRVRTLDHAIETLGRRPVRKLDPPVLAALRLGAYQLGYAGGVPRYAAVNESVELVRRARLERAVPFANAVLRRLGDGIRELSP
jgi:16S rRNA (cytosine967-C5)-methyltransferase